MKPTTYLFEKMDDSGPWRGLGYFAAAVMIAIPNAIVTTSAAPFTFFAGALKKKIVGPRKNRKINDKISTSSDVHLNL